MSHTVGPCSTQESVRTRRSTFGKTPIAPCCSPDPLGCALTPFEMLQINRRRSRSQHLLVIAQFSGQDFPLCSIRNARAAFPPTLSSARRDPQAGLQIIGTGFAGGKSHNVPYAFVRTVSLNSWASRRTRRALPHLLSRFVLPLLLQLPTFLSSRPPGVDLTLYLLYIVKPCLLLFFCHSFSPRRPWEGAMRTSDADTGEHSVLPVPSRNGRAQPRPSCCTRMFPKRPPFLQFGAVH